MDSLGQQIELWLLTQSDWVSAATICERFGVRERLLRADRDRQGLLSEFAICSDRGFKHIRNASDPEYRQAHERILAHLKHEARRLRSWRLRRQRERVGLRPIQFEKFTGQALLAV